MSYRKTPCYGKQDSIYTDDKPQCWRSRGRECQSKEAKQQLGDMGMTDFSL
jgi:hypothetical protein